MLFNFIKYYCITFGNFVANKQYFQESLDKSVQALFIMSFKQKQMNCWDFVYQFNKFT